MPAVHTLPTRNLAVSPKSFLLWLILVSISMFFAALTSAYLVKRGNGDWPLIEIPSLFGYTSLCIACSSISMHMAYLYAKQNSTQWLRIMLVVTSILGIFFLIGQYIGWQQLTQAEIYLVGHPSGSFIYVMSGAHAVHTIGGIVSLLFITGRSFQSQNSLSSIKMCTTYWHFLGILWVYLYVFFLIHQ